MKFIAPLVSLLLLSVGPSSLAVVAGWEVPPGHPIARSTVALSGPLASWGSGTLVAGGFVLTAAHNLIPLRLVKIYFGPRAGETERTAILPIFPWRDRPEDLALLLLDRDAPPPFAPVKIWPLGTEPPEGSKLYVAGFGISQGLDVTTLGTLRAAEVAYAGHSEDWTQIWIRSEPGGAHPWLGDSGGSVFVETPDGKFFLIATSTIAGAGYPFHHGVAILDGVSRIQPTIESLKASACGLAMLRFCAGMFTSAWGLR